MQKSPFFRNLQAAAVIGLLGSGATGIYSYAQQQERGKELVELRSEFEQIRNETQLLLSKELPQILEEDQQNFEVATRCSSTYHDSLITELAHLEEENRRFAGIEDPSNRIQQVRDNIAAYRSCSQEALTVLDELKSFREDAIQSREQLETAFGTESYNERLVGIEQALTCLDSFSARETRQERADHAVELLKEANQAFSSESAFSISSLHTLAFTRARLRDIEQMQQGNLDQLRESSSIRQELEQTCDQLTQLQEQVREILIRLPEAFQVYQGKVDVLEQQVKRIRDIAYRPEIAESVETHLQVYPGITLANFQEFDLETERGLRDFDNSYVELGTLQESINPVIERLEELEERLREQRLVTVTAHRDQIVMQNAQRIVPNPAYQERIIEECGSFDCFGNILVTRRRKNFFTGQEEPCCLVTRGNGQPENIQETYQIPVTTSFVELTIQRAAGEPTIELHLRKGDETDQIGWTEWKPFGDTQVYRGLGRLGPQEEIPYLVE